MRGKAKSFLLLYSLVRITPAYAGKSFTWVPLPFFAEDHPRLCGEKQFAMVSVTMRKGSPPPMRGKVVAKTLGYVEGRITPAYAGKSNRGTDFVPLPWDHPRLCGEKFGGQVKRACGKGSPPPMRGKACGTVKYLYATGITPAYAGKRTVLP